MATPDPGAASSAPPIDLRPLFAPASIAVIGASPRSSLALTVRDNLARMGSETRCHFVNPNYEEAFGQPCYPSLAALPERPIGDPRGQPVARGAIRPRGRRGRVPTW
jgi:acetyltransferase